MPRKQPEQAPNNLFKLSVYRELAPIWVPNDCHKDDHERKKMFLAWELCGLPNPNSKGDYNIYPCDKSQDTDDEIVLSTGLRIKKRKFQPQPETMSLPKVA